MNETRYQPIIPATLAVPTQVTEKRGVIRGWAHDPKAFVLGQDSGSAGLFMTMKDAITFIQKIYFDKILLSNETIEKLLQNYSLAENSVRSIVWDLRTTLKGRKVLFHSGYTGTFFAIDVKSKRAFIFLSNRVHPNDERAKYVASREKLLAQYFLELDELN
jgi:CubicO group peptidase (beta-lactamase class C family)